MSSKPKLLVFVVAYNAETTIKSVLTRIPRALANEYDVEILIIDDSSKDRTFEQGREARVEGAVAFPLRVLYNPVNQGYGGNQKIGYHYAIQNGFDYVALLHGDGQYAPECLPELVRPLARGEADAVFGSRMLIPGAALKGRMPLYKYVGNRILTTFQNKLLRTSLSEFHSGYRVYSVAALKRVPFHLNTRDFHFDTEIIIQLVTAEQRIVELAIPTYYGDEICHVSGMRYGAQVLAAAAKARLQELSLLYDRKFDCAPGNDSNVRYSTKLGFVSSHSVALAAVEPGQRVIDLGCAGGHFAQHVRNTRNCHVTGVDREPLASGVVLDGFVQHDLDDGPPPLDYSATDVVLLLDVIEHLRSPEQFAEALAKMLSPRTRLIVTSGNVGFLVSRLMLLVGQFNYGKRGILDLTHKRLFTFSSLRALFEQAGFDLVRCRGVPAPFPLAVGQNALSRLLLWINSLLIHVSKGLFAYQAYYEFHCTPSLGHLLRRAVEVAEEKEAAELPT